MWMRCLEGEMDVREVFGRQLRTLDTGTSGFRICSLLLLPKLSLFPSFLLSFFPSESRITSASKTEERDCLDSWIVDLESVSSLAAHTIGSRARNFSQPKTLEVPDLRLFETSELCSFRF